MLSNDTLPVACILDAGNHYRTMQQLHLCSDLQAVPHTVLPSMSREGVLGLLPFRIEADDQPRTPAAHGCCVWGYCCLWVFGNDGGCQDEIRRKHLDLALCFFGPLVPSR